MLVRLFTGKPLLMILVIICLITSCTFEYNEPNSNNNVPTDVLIKKDTTYKTIQFKDNFLFIDSLEPNEIIKTYVEKIEITVFQKKDTKKILKGKGGLMCKVDVHNNGIMSVDFPKKEVSKDNNLTFKVDFGGNVFFYDRTVNKQSIMAIDGLLTIYNYAQEEIHHQRILLNGADFTALKRFEFYELPDAKNRNFEKEKVKLNFFTKIDNQTFKYKNNTYVLQFKSIETAL